MVPKRPAVFVSVDPMLQKNMQAGIEMIPNYVRFEKKDAANIFLKIDFDMYLLLSEAERGVPVLFSSPIS